MTWTEFAEEIDGDFQQINTPNIGGTTIFRQITSANINIEKTIRRAHGVSSHYNVEKFKISLLIDNRNYGQFTIKKTASIKRIFGEVYDIQGAKPDLIFMESEALKYLFQYPKARLKVISNSIEFKSYHIGILKEEIHEIFNALNKLKTFLERIIRS